MSPTIDEQPPDNNQGDVVLETTPVDQEPKEQETGMFGGKLRILGFIVVLFILCATANLIVRIKWQRDKNVDIKKQEPLKEDDMMRVNGGEPPLDPIARQRALLMQQWEDEEDETPKEDLKALNKRLEQGERIEGSVLSEQRGWLPAVLKLLGSESGTWATVVARRLIHLAHIAGLILFAYLAIQVYNNGTADGQTTLFTPFSGLSFKERTFIVGICGMAAFQCALLSYSPGILRFIPDNVIQAWGMISSVLWTAWNGLRMALWFFHPFNFISTSVRRVLERMWKQMFLRKILMKAIPEGSGGLMQRALHGAYGHCIYAPLWATLFLGIHYLHIVYPGALKVTAETVLPWILPSSYEGLVVPAAAAAATTPLMATMFIWLATNFGFGLLFRPFGFKSYTGAALSPRQYYKKNKLGLLIHLALMVVCGGLLFICYMPFLQSFLQLILSRPLDTAIISGYGVFRSVAFTVLSVFLKVACFVVDFISGWMWPNSPGFLSFFLSVNYHAIAIYLLLGVPWVIRHFLDWLGISEWKLPHSGAQLFNGGTPDERKESYKWWMTFLTISVFGTFFLLMTYPLMLNYAIQGLNVFSLFGGPRFALPGMGAFHSNFYLLGPLYFLPLVVLVKLAERGYFLPHRIMAVKAKKESWLLYIKRKWVLPGLKIIGGLILTIFLYWIINVALDPVRLPELFAWLDAIVPRLLLMAGGFMRSLVESTSWVGPLTWTFGTAFIFSALLVYQPTFLDSPIGFLLYLPAYNFIGLILTSSLTVPNIPTAILVGGMVVANLLTLVGLLFRYLQRYRNWYCRWFVPYYDETKGLVAEY